jgi:hypothetical protein
VGAELEFNAALRKVYVEALPQIRARVKEMIQQGVPPKQAVDWGNGIRDELMRSTRAKSTGLGKALAEALKKESPSTEELIANKGLERTIEGIGRPLAGSVKWMVRARFAGTVLIVASTTMSVREVIRAQSSQRWKVVARESSTTIHAVGGGLLLGRLGACAGPWGAAAGALVGSTGGAIYGRWAGEELYELYVK